LDEMNWWHSVAEFAQCSRRHARISHTNPLFQVPPLRRPKRHRRMAPPRRTRLSRTPPRTTTAAPTAQRRHQTRLMPAQHSSTRRLRLPSVLPRVLVTTRQRQARQHQQLIQSRQTATHLQRCTAPRHVPSACCVSKDASTAPSAPTATPGAGPARRSSPASPKRLATSSNTAARRLNRCHRSPLLAQRRRNRCHRRPLLVQWRRNRCRRSRTRLMAVTRRRTPSPVAAV